MAKTALIIYVDHSCADLIPALNALGHVASTWDPHGVIPSDGDAYFGPQFGRATVGMVDAAKTDKDGLGPLVRLLVEGAKRVKRTRLAAEKPEKVRKPRKRKAVEE